MKVNDKVKVHMFSFGQEIETRNFNKVFTVHKKRGKLGIDWDTENIYGEEFCPFEAFAPTVIFENVETGEKFSFSTIKNGLEKIA